MSKSGGVFVGPCEHGIYVAEGDPSAPKILFAVALDECDEFIRQIRNSRRSVLKAQKEREKLGLSR